MRDTPTNFYFKEDYMNTPKIRTIQQCLNEIKTIDPNTAVTENFIRTLCKTSQVKHFKSGTKYLVNLDDLLSYLNYFPEGNDNG